MSSKQLAIMALVWLCTGCAENQALKLLDRADTYLLEENFQGAHVLYSEFLKVYPEDSGVLHAKSSKATIERPASKSFDTSNVIKADQFPSWHKSFVDKLGFGTVFKSVLNLRSLDTIKDWGEKILRQHRAEDLLALPDFMRPQQVVKAATVSAPVHRAPFSLGGVAQAAAAPVKSQLPSPVTRQPEEHGKRLICAHCAAKITYPEGKFCWNNAKRFGGLAYCREHQAPG